MAQSDFDRDRSMRSETPVIDRRNQSVENLGACMTRYGLVLVLVWIGGMKFTTYEAEGIKGLVANSPLMSWALRPGGPMTLTMFSSVLGVIEIAVGAMLALNVVSRKIGAIGASLAILLFLTTLSFMFTTPGVIEPSLGAPALSASPGQFLLKDIVFLGASVWLLGRSLSGMRC